MNTQILDQIIWDSQNNLEEKLLSLQEMPEHFVNVLFTKSFDEMNETERTLAVEEIEEYLKSNMSSKEERMNSIELAEYDRGGCDNMSYYLLTDEDISEDEAWEWIEENTSLEISQLDFIGDEESVANHRGVKTAIVFHETREGYFQRVVNPNDFKVDTDCIDVESFQEDDNLGWCSTIDKITYYKVKDWNDDRYTIFFENNLVKIH